MAGSVLYDFFFFLGTMLVQTVLTCLCCVIAPLAFFIERYQSRGVSGVMGMLRRHRKTYKSIFITGGSSGLGEHLAYAFAADAGRVVSDGGSGNDTRKQHVHIVLTGRSEERLRTVAAHCETLGVAPGCVTTETHRVDVSDQAAMAKVMLACDDAHPIDLVIANAGVGRSACGAVDNSKAVSDTTQPLFAINVDGVFNTLHPLLTRMRTRRVGQLVVMSSLAGLATLPSFADYSASKKAVAAYGTALRHLCAFDNVGVTVIHPGFVRSKMTDAHNADVPGSKHPIPMPCFMEAEPAAQIMKDGIERNVGSVVYPWPVYMAVHFLAILPPPLMHCLCSLLTTRKEATVTLGKLPAAKLPVAKKVQ